MVEEDVHGAWVIIIDLCMIFFVGIDVSFHVEVEVSRQTSLCGLRIGLIIPDINIYRERTWGYSVDPADISGVRHALAIDAVEGFSYDLVFIEERPSRLEILHIVLCHSDNPSCRVLL